MSDKSYREAIQESTIASSDDEKKETISKRINRYHKYSIGTGLFEISPIVQWWQQFFDLGIIDCQKLKEIVVEYISPENPKIKESWKELIQFEYLNDEKFERLLKEVKFKFTKREYQDLGIVKHITGIFLLLSKEGLDNEFTPEKILKDSISYIDHLKENNIITERISQQQIYQGNDGYQGFFFRGRELDEFRFFLAYIDEVQEQLNDNYMKQILISSLEKNLRQFSTIIQDSSDRNSEYYDFPIYKYIEPRKFVEKIVSIDFQNHQFIIRALQMRYKYYDFDKKLSEVTDEIGWLKSISHLLSEEANRKKGKLSGYNLESFKNKFLDKFIASLESSLATNAKRTLEEE